jgi:hypothetical protein
MGASSSSSYESPENDPKKLTQIDIQDMQNQMAQMEAMGRQEEFVTSANHLQRDDLKF